MRSARGARVPSISVDAFGRSGAASGGTPSPSGDDHQGHAEYDDVVGPRMAALRAEIVRLGAFERRPVLLRDNASDARSLANLVTAEELLRSRHLCDANVPRPPEAPRCAPVKGYGGGFYKPLSLSPSSDGAVDGGALRALIASGGSIVWQRTHDWLAASAALKDAASEHFQRRSGVNVYMTAGGRERGMDAHNDPHCTLITQSAGSKRWRIWVREDKLLPTQHVDPQSGEHYPDPEQQYGLDAGKVVGPNYSELGLPHYDWVCAPRLARLILTPSHPLTPSAPYPTLTPSPSRPRRWLHVLPYMAGPLAGRHALRSSWRDTSHLHGHGGGYAPDRRRRRD